MRHSSLPIACLAALALPAAATAEGESRLSLPGAQLQVQSAQWGAGRDPGSFGEWIADVEKPRVPAPTVKAPPASKLRTPSPTRDPGAAAVPVRGESIENLYFEHSVKTARDVASGQASGKRVQEPATPTNGSLVLRLASPWTSCAVGDRFNGVYLTIGTTHRYRLDGLEVATCSAEQVSFYYAKVEHAGS